MASLRPLLKIGARGSQLALWQAHWVADLLAKNGVTAEIVVIRTRGDVEQSGPVRDLGVQGVFTNEIQQAILRRDVDLAVHSLKDLPTAQVDGLMVAAVTEREEAADALVTRDVGQLTDLPLGALIGTGSLRRQAQLKALRSDLNPIGVRGNVDTRLRKLDAGEFDAVVLAAAGLRRLGLEGRICQLLAPPLMLPAPGQGALAIECRIDDPQTIKAITPLDHPATRQATLAERTVLRVLRGGCSTPVATWGRIEGDALILDGLIASSDGRRVIRSSARTHDADSLAAAEALGQQVADALLAQGGAEMTTQHA